MSFGDPRFEPLIFERSTSGRLGYQLPEADMASEPVENLVPDEHIRRDALEGLPELSELDVVRHFTRISQQNYGVDTGLYPLGSCTMKYNPKVNESVARLLGFASSHPYQPEDSIQGNLRVIQELGEALVEISGLDAVTCQPAAGAQGEMVGMFVIRAYLDKTGESDRNVVLIPDSAHGTNPASVALAGFKAKEISSNKDGMISVSGLEEVMDDSVAALMLTNPNTLGIFEKEISRVCELVHERGGLVYCDGANLNALMGVSRPGDTGVDVLHINLHKTFSTPHGGGGPGAGPVAVRGKLEPFLPSPVLREEDGKLRWDYDRPDSMGRIKSFFGNFGMLVRALAFIRANGPEGLRQSTEAAILNANYIKHRLKDVYQLPYPSPTLHECVLNDHFQKPRGVSTLDIAKRLIDYGFHPPTIYFPLIVSGALMIEPTESASLEELDSFIEAMIAIDRESKEDPELLKKAPHGAARKRLDEVRAARKPELRWSKKSSDES